MFSSKILVVLLCLSAAIAFDESKESTIADTVTTLATPESEDSSELPSTLNDVTVTTEPSTVSPVEVHSDVSNIQPSRGELNVNDSGRLIGVSTCHENVSCNDLPNTYCREGFCHCLESHVPLPNSKSCVKSAEKIGDKCESSKECEKIRALCKNGVCLLPVVPKIMHAGYEDASGATTLLVGSFFIFSLAATSLLA